ncbi:MAG: 3',5'-cyclic-nucleotide phosphodiesterase [Nitrosomonadaceae bacterium]|jgi:Cft2 family RNA processing exonuclease|nr:3',5'-cyclic-nucleotide phosphodiesterase [Nitrosomonadaceae bacterium]
MRVRVLGASGGIGGDLRTTALAVDDDILIDAGTGVGDLTLEELVKIDHIFVTHSHLDHITSIPFLVDTVIGLRTKPVVVHSTAEILQILKDHIFNWKIWPDFSKIPTPETAFMVFRELRVGQPVDIGGRKFTAIPANHVVPAVGYLLDSGESRLIFSGDTTVNDALWATANATPSLKYIIIETAFPDKERDIAIASKHLCPSMLAEELAKLNKPVEILVTHLKPGEVFLTMSEIGLQAGKWRPRLLEQGMILTI